MYAGVERRRYPRLSRGFLVHYPVLGDNNVIDLSQIKNISLGGALFTTLGAYDKGADIPLKIKLPGAYVTPQGKVVESSSVSEGTIFNTRVEFSSMDDSDREKISQVLEHYMNQDAA